MKNCPQHQYNNRPVIRKHKLKLLRDTIYTPKPSKIKDVKLELSLSYIADNNVKWYINF